MPTSMVQGASAWTEYPGTKNESEAASLPRSRVTVVSRSDFANNECLVPVGSITRCQ